MTTPRDRATEQSEGPRDISAERMPPGVTITMCPDGPLLVRGTAIIVDDHGEPLESHRRTIALCRCGASTIRPFCDGSHKLIGFRTRRPTQEPAVRMADPID